MLKQKEVVITGSAGGTVNAGAAGLGFMLQPTTKAGTTQKPGTFPVRVRLNGDTAREIIILDGRPVFVQGGFTELAIVEDAAGNAGRRFLATVFEVTEDWMGNGHRPVAVHDGQARGETLIAVPGYVGSTGAVMVARGDDASGVPFLARDGAQGRALRGDAEGNLFMRPAAMFYTGLLDVALFGAQTDGSHWLRANSTTTQDPALATPLDVAGFRRLELSVRGGFWKVDTLEPSDPTVRVYLEWSAEEYPALGNDINPRPLLAEVELVGHGTDINSAGLVILDEAAQAFTAGTVTGLPWRPRYVRVRYECTNADGLGLRIRLAGRA